MTESVEHGQQPQQEQADQNKKSKHLVGWRRVSLMCLSSRRWLRLFQVSDIEVGPELASKHKGIVGFIVGNAVGTDVLWPELCGRQVRAAHARALAGKGAQIESLRNLACIRAEFYCVAEKE